MFMFLIDCSAQNAYSLFRLQNEASNDKKQREKQLELLAFDLIKHNVKSRFEKAALENFNGRLIDLIRQQEEFLMNVMFLFNKN